MRMQLDREIITPEMDEIKSMIIETVVKRDTLKSEMELWYSNNPQQSFPSMKDLILVDSTLSKLDTFYKKLWDYNNLNKA